MKLSLTLLTFLLTGFSFAQQRMIVYFSDKPNSETVTLTEKAELRRQKNNVSVDDKDINISADYLVQLEADGNILNRSRWLNAVTYETNLTDSDLLAKYDFIDHIHVIAPATRHIKKDQFEYVEPKSLNYGVADTQVRQIGADCLHDMGFTGQGVYLALIDAGFRGMDTVSCFDSVFLENRILDTYDFVNNIGVYDYSGHGTAVGSCIFGEKSGFNTYSGTAVDVDIALYVSEDVNSETLIEEFNLVAALERCDSVGVDLASISLGYTLFDNPSDDHTYWDMDGQTTIAAQGINTAVSKGILVLAAAGNDGPSWISTPCDADSSLCIGAVDNQGTYADFSSVGPASDGQPKPDVMATGKHTWVFLEDGTLVMGNGTSFATPVMAGGAACLLQANPQNTVLQIIQSIRESATQYTSPDGYMGYGIPDLCVANDSLVALGVGLNEIKGEQLIIYPNPANSEIILKGISSLEDKEVEITNVIGEIIYSDRLGVNKIDVSRYPEGVYFISVKFQDKVLSKKFVIKR